MKRFQGFERRPRSDPLTPKTAAGRIARVSAGRHGPERHPTGPGSYR